VDRPVDVFIHGIIHEFDLVHPDGAGAAPQIDWPITADAEVRVQVLLLFISLAK
jgi:hypothetical protein